MGKINFDVVLENLSENQLNRDFGEFFNISKFNDILFSVILNSEERVLNIDDDFGRVFETQIINEISQIENIEEILDFNFSLDLDSRPILYEDINLSFSSFFGKIYKNLDYENIKEVFPKIPSINFNVLKNKVCLDFKKINEEFSSIFHNLIIGENDVNHSNRKKFFKTKSLLNKVNFNSDVEMILDNVSFDDINSSFNLIFGNLSKQNKTVENFFHIEESKNLDVEFDYDFDKNDFLRLNEYFESFFECKTFIEEILEEPKPFYINFKILKENLSLDFKTLNHEFSSYFPKFEKVVEVDEVDKFKELKELIGLKEFQPSDCNFNYNLVEDLSEYDFSKMNHDFNGTFYSDLIKLQNFTKGVQFENEFREIDLSVKMIFDNFEIEDINSSFNLIFGEVFRDEQTKKVENFFHIEESKNLDVEFNYDFDKNDFLRMDEHFESFFDFSKSDIEILEEPKPFYINFKILKENLSLDFKTLNHEFSSYFPKPIDIVQNKNVKDLKDSVEIKEFNSSDLNFDLLPIEESFDKFEMNDDFEYFFDLNSNKVVKPNSVVKVLDIDLTRRRVNKESLETFKSDPLEFFVPEFSSKTKLKDEIVKETDQIIDNKIEGVEEKYNSILNSELDQIQKNHKKNIESLKQEHDRKLTNMMNEFNLFKKMMLDQMSSVKSTFLSATSGGGAVNILDMDDVNPSELSHGKTLLWNDSIKKFEFKPTKVQDTQILEISQENVDNGYIELDEPADPELYDSSTLELNGLVNYHGHQYNFITETRIDISQLEINKGDYVRVVYTKS